MKIIDYNRYFKNASKDDLMDLERGKFMELTKKRTVKGVLCNAELFDWFERLKVNDPLVFSLRLLLKLILGRVKSLIFYIEPINTPTMVFFYCGMKK